LSGAGLFLSEISRAAESEEGGRDLAPGALRLRMRGVVLALRVALEEERALRRPFLLIRS